MFDIIEELGKFYITHESRVYPNAILLNKNQLHELYPQVEDDESILDKLDDFYGLKVIFTNHTITPRLLKL